MRSLMHMIPKYSDNIIIYYILYIRPRFRAADNEIIAHMTADIAQLKYPR